MNIEIRPDLASHLSEMAEANDYDLTYYVNEMLERGVRAWLEVDFTAESVTKFLAEIAKPGVRAVDCQVWLQRRPVPPMTPAEYLADARRLNPKLRYALRKEPDAHGCAVLGAFDVKNGSFVAVANEIRRGSGFWTKVRPVLLEIDGVIAGSDPAEWEE